MRPSRSCPDNQMFINVLSGLQNKDLRRMRFRRFRVPVWLQMIAVAVCATALVIAASL